MERLTKYEVVGGHVHAVPTGDVDQAMMRLAAYEDTGLTPKRCAATANMGRAHGEMMEYVTPAVSRYGFRERHTEKQEVIERG